MVMEADLDTGATRPEVQFNQFLTDKLRAWKRVQVDRVTREQEELEDNACRQFSGLSPVLNPDWNTW